MHEIFGVMPNGDAVQRVTLANPDATVRILTYGAAIQTLEVPDRAGERANVVLGLTDLAAYIDRSPHFGAVPGRFAGRIASGRFTLDGTNYQLSINRPPHTVHGGANGFGRRNWTLLDHSPSHASLSIISPDGEEGFPGTVHTTVRYSLHKTVLTMHLGARTDRPTVINLTNHSYFNLDGEGAGDCLNHQLRIAADRFLPIAANGIPTGEMLQVEATPFDFRSPRKIGDRIRTRHVQLERALGYDHAFMLSGTGLREAAVLHSPASGRTLTMHTTQPALQLYTGNTLDGTLAGPSGRLYRSSDGVCLEAQSPQDSPNHANFPSTILRPEQPFAATTVFEFGTTAT